MIEADMIRISTAIAHRLSAQGVAVGYMFDDLVSIGVVAGLDALRRWCNDGRSRPITFIWWRIRGAMIDEVRRACRSNRNQLKHRLGVPMPACNDYDPETRLEAMDFIAQMRNAIDTLDDDDRHLLISVYFDGSTMASHAKHVDASLATISRRHARVISTLRRKLNA